MKTALCIGINDYPGTDSDLAGCVNDAQDWQAALKRRGFVSTLLVDRNATGKAMRGGIARVIESAKSGDSVIITFSGHGTFVPDDDGDEPDSTDEALCPWDVYKNGPLIDDELAELLGRAAEGVKVAFLSDSCHSGTVTRFQGLMAPLQDRRVKFLPPATFLSRAKAARLDKGQIVKPTSKPGRNSGLLLSGCQDVEYSYDATFGKRANGAFTYVALQTLRTLPAGATYTTWFNAIRKRLPSQDYPQRPNLYGSNAQKRWRALA